MFRPPSREGSKKSVWSEGNLLDKNTRSEPAFGERSTLWSGETILKPVSSDRRVLRPRYSTFFWPKCFPSSGASQLFIPYYTHYCRNTSWGFSWARAVTEVEYLFGAKIFCLVGLLNYLVLMSYCTHYCRDAIWVDMGVRYLFLTKTFLRRSTVATPNFSLAKSPVSQTSSRSHLLRYGCPSTNPTSTIDRPLRTEETCVDALFSIASFLPCVERP